MLASRTLKEALEKAFDEYKGKKILKYKKKKYSYRDLHKISNMIIHYLNNLGLKYGDKLAIMAFNIPEFAFVNIAAIRMGVTVLPLNFLLKTKEIEYILKDSGVKILFIQSKFMEVIAPLTKKKILDAIILLDEGKGYPKLNEELKKCESTDINITYPVKFNDIAIIIYTSGTTGRPKGVMLSHRNIFSNIRDLIIVTKVRQRTKIITMLPLFHAYFYTATFILPLVWNMPMFFLDDLSNGKLIIETLVKERIGWLIAIPTIFNAIGKAKIPKIVKLLNALKVCISGAAPLPITTINNFKDKFGIEIHEGYGLSETSPVIAVNDPNLPTLPGSVGKPLPSTIVKIIDSDEKELPTGEIGEIIVKGPNVMVGYYNQKTETKKVIKNDWLFTGDLGKFDQQGNLYIVDRKKDLIIRNGMNIYPQEIERILMKEENIKEIAVVGLEVSHGIEMPIAFYETIDEKELPAHILRNLCKKYLADYKVPQQYKFMKELPKTPTGKVLKRELKKLKL